MVADVFRMFDGTASVNTRRWLLVANLSSFLVVPSDVDRLFYPGSQIMSFWDEIRKIPPVTRTLCASSLAVSVPVMLQLLSPYKVVFVRELVTMKWEVRCKSIVILAVLDYCLSCGEYTRASSLVVRRASVAT